MGRKDIFQNDRLLELGISDQWLGVDEQPWRIPNKTTNYKRQEPNNKQSIRGWASDCGSDIEEQL